MNRLAVALGAGTLTVLGATAAGLALVLRAGPSPARGTIAFLGRGSPGTCHGRAYNGVGPLYLVAARGGKRRPFLRGKRAANPSWSPDGRSLAFTLFTCGAAGGTSIAVTDDRGGGLRLVTHGPVDREPAWSPDGRTIAFVRESAGQHGGFLTRLYTVAAAGGKARPAGTSRHVDHPSWSADGRRLVITRGRSGVGTNDPAWLSTIRPDGSGLRRITAGPYDDLRPAWSPDGKWIAFTRVPVPTTPEYPPAGLYLVHPDGSGLHRLSKGTFFDPAWSPDGEHIVSSGRDYADLQRPYADWSLRIMQAHGLLAGTRYRRWTATPRNGADLEPTWRAQ